MQILLEILLADSDPGGQATALAQAAALKSAAMTQRLDQFGLRARERWKGNSGIGAFLLRARRGR